MKGELSHDSEVKVGANMVWEVYGGLQLPKMVNDLFPDVVGTVKVVQGDGGIGTVVKFTFPQATPYIYYVVRLALVISNKTVLAILKNGPRKPAQLDPETAQTIMIGRKVGQQFELTNLSIPHYPTIPLQSAASVASPNSLELWPSCLDHVSFSRAYDFALFIRKFTQGIILVLLYVDDMIITGSDLDCITTLKQDLNHHFERKDLGTLSYFLGLEVSTATDGYYLSQAKYDSNLLSRAGLTNSKTASTPLEPNLRFIPLNGTALRDPTLYRTLVGSLVYLTIGCHDIAYVVHLGNQFLSAPQYSLGFPSGYYIHAYIKALLYIL
ncbi:hypothetical protein RJ639_010593 [Escallonia herrerae]|uniref:Reverse transcriptase Ty1/copia-type domain-containing protein n=1 Tax=Escallonia herrerae TaxID=1293975 RepID=A0AA89ANQ3_9ASTE|nr:hypothetical protein RJ639_010593 [Escallonia herrerae]